MGLDLEVRCRRCEACLVARRRLWAERARVELGRSYRTWFGTLTLSPAEHYRAQLEAGGSDEFGDRHEAISKWLTRWLKRVRKNSGARIRYLLVCEHHASGMPHYHVLLHQVTPVDVTWRHLADAWTHGFTNFKLVEDCTSKHAFYVCKYLSKSAEARVRASVMYGQEPVSPLTASASPQGGSVKTTKTTHAITVGDVPGCDRGSGDPVVSNVVTPQVVAPQATLRGLS